MLTDTSGSDEQHSEREVGTKGKSLLIAKEDGFLDAIDVYNRNKVLQFKCSSAVNCCTFVSEYEVVGGTQDGSLWVVDMRSPRLALGVYRRSASPILSFSTLSNHGVLASTGDGSCFFWRSEVLSQTSEDFNSWELTGPDCDPVYSVGCSANTVYTACRDAKIRKYILKQSDFSS